MYALEPCSASGKRPVLTATMADEIHRRAGYEPVSIPEILATPLTELRSDPEATKLWLEVQWIRHGFESFLQALQTDQAAGLQIALPANAGAPLGPVTRIGNQSPAAFCQKHGEDLKIDTIRNVLRLAGLNAIRPFMMKAFGDNACADDMPQLQTLVRTLHEHSNFPSDALENMGEAIGNSEAFLWYYLGAIAPVFERDVGRRPTSEELYAIARKSERIIVLLASCHIQIFLSVQTQVEYDILQEDYASLSLRRHGQDAVLAVLSSIVNVSRYYYRGSQRRFGCSALYADLSNGLDAMRFTYQLKCEIARRTLFPIQAGEVEIEEY